MYFTPVLEWLWQPAVFPFDTHFSWCAVCSVANHLYPFSCYHCANMVCSAFPCPNRPSKASALHFSWWIYFWNIWPAHIYSFVVSPAPRWLQPVTHSGCLGSRRVTKWQQHNLSPSKRPVTRRWMDDVTLSLSTDIFSWPVRLMKTSLYWSKALPK